MDLPGSQREGKALAAHLAPGVSSASLRLEGRVYTVKIDVICCSPTAAGGAEPRVLGPRGGELPTLPLVVRRAVAAQAPVRVPVRTPPPCK